MHRERDHDLHNAAMGTLTQAILTLARIEPPLSVHAIATRPKCTGQQVEAVRLRPIRTESGVVGAYALVQEVGARVCPYCQLHHVNYHMPAGKQTFSLRSPLDHLPRSYPYLAVCSAT